MNEISASSYDLNTMCRLCLNRDLMVIDIFSVSTKMRSKVADIIMKCTPVRITKGDKMPKFICQVCYTQLEQIHQFQMQAVQSEKTLRQFLQQIHAFDKQITPECSIQKPINEPFVHNYVAETIVKCEPFEFIEFDKKDKGLANFDKIYEELSMKSLVKDEPLDDYNLTSTECHNDTQCILPNNDGNDISFKNSNINVNDSKLGENIDINGEAKESANVNTRKKINEELCPKSEIKNESINDYYSSIFIESVYDTENALYKGDSREVSCKNTKTDTDPKSENLESSRSADATKYFDKREEKIKNISSVFNASFCESTILRHNRTHTDDKPYQCDVCKKSFSQESKFNIHKRAHNGEKPYQCNICKKGFSQAGSLNTHKRVHTGEKPYVCGVCNARFSDSSILRRYKHIHTGDKPYQCDVCEKRFSQTGSLNKHKRIHTGEKPYHCDICGKCFSQAGILNIHKRIHTGEKPYQCGVCNASFSDSSILRRHKSIHSGDKPYECDVCKKRFSQDKSLNNHKRRHTGEKLSM